MIVRTIRQGGWWPLCWNGLFNDCNDYVCNGLCCDDCEFKKKIASQLSIITTKYGNGRLKKWLAF